jgi:hypothetical protein
MYSPFLLDNISWPTIELIIVDFPALIFPIKLILIFVPIRLSLIAVKLELSLLY